MQAKEWSFVDKSTFGDGPWQSEPDKVQWQDERTQLPCLAVRGPQGAWCGYVGVPEGHRLYGLDYQSVEEIEVHGGLTYASACVEEDREHSICHVPGEGEPDHVWWFGFDCSHCWDIAPGMDARLRLLGAVPPSSFASIGTWAAIYRDLDYVRAECRSLAKQIAQPTRGNDRGRSGEV